MFIISCISSSSCSFSLIFDDSTDVNINARALTIKTEIPGAIFRSATQADDGVDSVFQDVDGFVNRTTQVYVRAFIESMCLALIESFRRNTWH